MNQPFHDFSEPILVRTSEEQTQQRLGSINFGGQTTNFQQIARKEEQPS